MNKELQNYSHDPTDYDLLDPIGSGAFATVYKAFDKKLKTHVAIKVLNLDIIKINFNDIKREIISMSELNHKNIIKLLACFVNNRELWIVMPLSMCSLKHLIKKYFSSGIKDEAVLAYIMKNMLEALEYIHRDGKIHRDIKCDNIMIDCNISSSNNNSIKLCDFGVVGYMIKHGRHTLRKTLTGTFFWMAPEVLLCENDGYDYKADIWSLGITLMEMAFSKPPYEQYGSLKSIFIAMSKEVPTCDIYNTKNKFSKSFHNFLKKCLYIDPHKRWNATKLLNHKFIKKSKDCKYWNPTV